MSKQCLHIIVAGRVQGVFFRESAIKKAIQFDVTGWVRNCEDGTVELIACGKEVSLKKLLTWLHKGPPLAKVSSVTHEAIEWREFTTFSRR